MSFLVRLINTGARAGIAAAEARARTQIEHQYTPKSKGGMGKRRPKRDGCTPCAAYAKADGAKAFVRSSMHGPKTSTGTDG